MSEIHDTEFAQAWAEDRDDRQPEQGRETPPNPEGQDDDAGADADAERNQPAEEAPTPDAESDQPARDAENPDEFAGLPEAVVARIREAEARAYRAENTLRSNDSRYSRAERELNDLRGRFLSQPKPEPVQAPEVKTILDDETRAKLADYDDLGPVIIKSFDALQARVEQAESSVTQDRTRQSERELAEAERARGKYLGRQAAILTERHPDFTAIVGKPEYAAWADVQPAFIQDMIRSNGQALVDGEAAAFVFDKFKADTAPREQPSDPDAQRRQRQLDGSAHIPAKAPAFTPSETGTSADFDEEWKRAAEEEKRASARR